MSVSVKKVVLAEQESHPETNISNKNYLGLVNHIEVECMVRIGSLKITIGQLRELKLGQALHLQQHTDEPVDLLLNNKVFARGELMTHDQCFAVKITEICS